MRVEDPVPPEERLTLVGLREAVRPEEGETDAERATLPEKVLRLARLMTEVPDDPDWIVRLVGLLEMLKFGPEPTMTVVDEDPVAPFESVTESCTV